MSLSRLWQAQGKCAAAHEVLAEIYGWFTEGFDTADLQEAKALLDELSCLCIVMDTDTRYGLRGTQRCHGGQDVPVK